MYSFRTHSRASFCASAITKNLASIEHLCVAGMQYKDEDYTMDNEHLQKYLKEGREYSQTIFQFTLQSKLDETNYLYEDLIKKKRLKNLFGTNQKKVYAQIFLPVYLETNNPKIFMTELIQRLEEKYGTKFLQKKFDLTDDNSLKNKEHYLLFFCYEWFMEIYKISYPIRPKKSIECCFASQVFLYQIFNTQNVDATINLFLDSIWYNKKPENSYIIMNSREDMFPEMESVAKDFYIGITTSTEKFLENVVWGK